MSGVCVSSCSRCAYVRVDLCIYLLRCSADLGPLRIGLIYTEQVETDYGLVTIAKCASVHCVCVCVSLSRSKTCTGTRRTAPACSSCTRRSLLPIGRIWIKCWLRLALCSLLSTSSWVRACVEGVFTPLLRVGHTALTFPLPQVVATSLTVRLSSMGSAILIGQSRESTCG